MINATSFLVLELDAFVREWTEWLLASTHNLIVYCVLLLLLNVIITVGVSLSIFEP